MLSFNYSLLFQVCESQKHLTSKLLPKRASRVLQNTLRTINKDYEGVLEDLYNSQNGISAPSASRSVADWDARRMDPNNSLDRDFKRKKKEQDIEQRIQDAFLKFMVSTLKGYRRYLKAISKAPSVGATDPNALFDLNSFLRSRDKAHHKFYQLLMRTQMFIRFIEECSFVSDGDQGLAFFDECSEKFDTDSDADIQFLEWATTSSSDRTKFILPPDCNPGTPSMGPGFTYKRFELDVSLLKQHAKQKQNHRSHVSNFLANVSAASGSGVSLVPGSPLARRTKHEIKAAHKLARVSQQRPESWANYLLGTCYSLYFLVLPSLLGQQATAGHTQKADVEMLQFAFKLLEKAAKFRIQCDEVCYRVMMQLCGVHNQPVLAVRLNYLMKRTGVQQNAITYGFYNRCVLEATWPQDEGGVSQMRWKRLKNVVGAAAQFKRDGLARAEKRKEKLRALSVSQENNLDGGDDVGASRTSLESQGVDAHELGSGISFFNDRGALQKIRDRLGGIVKQTTGSFGGGMGVTDEEQQQPGNEVVTNSAGLLIAGEGSARNSGGGEQMKPASPRDSYDLSPRLVTRSDSFGGDTKLMDKIQRQQSLNLEQQKGRRILQFNDDDEDEEEEEEEDEEGESGSLVNGNGAKKGNRAANSSQESVNGKEGQSSPNT